MTDYNAKIYNIAAAEKGIVEWAEGSNPKVVKYYAASGHPEIKQDSVPWCAAFVGYVLSRAGLKGTGSLLARSYEKWGYPVSHTQARRGDIGVMPRGSKSWQGHVFVVVKIVGDKVYALGGNQNDSVNVTIYRLTGEFTFRRAMPLKPTRPIVAPRGENPITAFFAALSKLLGGKK